MNGSALKRPYDGIAVFAVLNMLVFGTMGAYLLGTGTLDGVKLQQIAAVLRGEEQLGGDQEGVSEDDPAGVEVSETEQPQVATVGSQAELEIIRREAARIQEELRQRLALNNSILLRITTEREGFQREREEAARTAKVERAERETEGFAKQIAILESVKPKTALVHLLGLGDPDEAAATLLAMNTRKAKKIVEAAKSPEQMEQMKLVVRQLRSVSPDRSKEIVPEP